MLPNLRVASPCSADWNRMQGDDRVRFCPECRLDVYDFSAMTAREIEQLLAKREGRLCARLFRRSDGTLLTRDCPVGFRTRVKRASLVAGAVLSALLRPTFLPTQSSSKPHLEPSSQSAQISPRNQMAGAIAVTVIDPSGAVIPKAHISVLDDKRKLVSEGETNGVGRFEFSSLSLGSYSIQATSFGFGRGELVNVSVQVGAAQMNELTLRLEVGTAGGVEVVPVDTQVEPELIAIPDLLPFASVPRAPSPHNRSRIKRFFIRIRSNL